MLDNGEPLDIIYIDFAKAFDKVPINKLIYKLEHFGISGNLLIWIRNFLSNRKYCVKVNNDYSEEFHISSGVPQGTVLAATLFIIYTFDLVHELQSHHALFADDTKLFNSPTNHNTLANDLLKIELWSEIWCIPLNKLKCSVLHIGQKNPILPYFFNSGEQLESVDTQRDLGVVVDKNLSWSNHIDTIVKKCNSRLFLYNKVFHNKSAHFVNKMYKTYVRPILDFNAPIWSPHLKKDINTIEQIQRRVSKVPLNLKSKSYLQRLKSLNLTTLESRRKRGDLIYSYIILNDKISIDLKYMFILNNSTRTRGHSKKLFKERTKKDIRKYFFSNRVFCHWNSLTDVMINAPSTNSFKARIDDLFSHQ